MKKNPETDRYIEKSAEFARPVLATLRDYVHAACPEVTEEIKWGMPVFVYKKKILCNMAAFKAHCAFGFWLAPVMEDPHGLISMNANRSMGDLGRMSSEKDIPPYHVLESYIQQAAFLVDQGVTLPKKAAVPRREIEIPDYFAAVLNAEPETRTNFMGMSPSHRREYLEWITEAKQESTRVKRMAQAMEWLREGKSRHWKHKK